MSWRHDVQFTFVVIAAESRESSVPPSEGQQIGFDEDAFLGRSSRAGSHDSREGQFPEAILFVLWFTLAAQ